jgi:hypothetical protein
MSQRFVPIGKKGGAGAEGPKTQIRTLKRTYTALLSRLYKLARYIIILLEKKIFLKNKALFLVRLVTFALSRSSYPFFPWNCRIAFSFIHEIKSPWYPCHPEKPHNSRPCLRGTIRGEGYDISVWKVLAQWVNYQCRPKVVPGFSFEWACRSSVVLDISS